MADEELSNREALSAAYDKHVEAAPPEEAAPVVETPADSEPAAAAAETSAISKGEASSPAAAAGTPAPVQAAPAVAPVSGTKPPRSWSAEAKAAFAALPEPVKQDVLRREKEISQGLERTAPARQHFERFSEVVKPFEPLLHAYNVDALDAVKTLMSTRAALEIGTPEQKAQIVAGIVHDFGIDVTMLDALLVQRGPVRPFQPAPARPAPQRDPEVQALLDQINQAKTERAEAEIAKIEALPHFDEVCEDIADIVEAFHKAGKTISLENAYKRALTLNPDLEPATAAPTISKSQAAAILASRNAAGSVSGAPRTGATPVADDRRSQLAAAYDRARA